MQTYNLNLSIRCHYLRTWMKIALNFMMAGKKALERYEEDAPDYWENVVWGSK